MSAAAPALDLSQPISGPAYGRGYRIGASIVMALIVVMIARRYDELAPLANTTIGGFFIAGFVALVASYVLLLKSVTTIDEQGIRQSGLLEKKVAWQDIRYARLKGIGSSKRLVISTGFGKFRAFYAGTPALAQAFRRISAAYAPRG